MKTPLKVIRKEYPRIRVRVKANTTSYEVDCRSVRWTGQPYFSYPTQKEAFDKAQEVAKAVVEFGVSGINHDDIKLLARIRKKLAPFHLGPEEAVDRYIESQAHNVTLQKTEAITDVTRGYLVEKQSPMRPLRPDTLRGIKFTCAQLKKCFGDRPIGTITKDEVEKALETNYATNSTRRDLCNRFKSFFKFAKEKKFIKTNPCEGIKIRPIKGETLILDNESVVTLLGNLLTEPKLIPFVCLELFAGLRPTECGKIQWKDIHLDERRSIYISSSVSKVHTDRNTPIHDCLYEWLKDYLGKPIKIKNLRKTLDSVKEGLPWQQDILRHTAISNFMCMYSNIYLVSEHLGNSPDIVKKHYQRAILKADCEFFWSLTPDKVRELILERKEKEAKK